MTKKTPPSPRKWTWLNTWFAILPFIAACLADILYHDAKSFRGGIIVACTTVWETLIRNLWTLAMDGSILFIAIAIVSSVYVDYVMHEDSIKLSRKSHRRVISYFYIFGLFVVILYPILRFADETERNESGLYWAFMSYMVFMGSIIYTYKLRVKLNLT